MSSTNRGTIRQTDDLYETPSWTTQLILKYENLKEPILEPAVGHGKIKNVLLKRYNDVTGIDVNPKFNPDIATDFLNYNSDKKYKTIITNPPFSYAKEYIEKCHELLAEDGKIILLLRLNFLESKGRIDLWKKYKIKRLYVLSERPKFFNNKTDSIAYAWYVFEPIIKQDKTELTIISKTELDSVPDQLQIHQYMNQVS